MQAQLIPLAEIFMAIQLTIEDENYQKALKKRGIENLELIQIDPWPHGGFVNKNIKKGNRALKAISFFERQRKGQCLCQANSRFNCSCGPLPKKSC